MVWFKLKQLTLEDYQKLPEKFVFEGILNCPAEELIDFIVEENLFAKWLQDFVSVKWIEKKDEGIFSKRQVNLKTLAVKEYFIRWERGQRLSFLIYEMTIPLLNYMLEDYIFEALAPQKTRICWTVYYQPKWFIRPILPLARKIFGKMFQQSFENLKKLAVKV